MLTIHKPRDRFGVQLQGDFFDFDRLYFAIFKLTGQFGIDSKCPFPGYGKVCEYILALCYELRHAYQGDRGLVSMYNGVIKEWFEKNEFYEDELFEDSEFDDDVIDVLYEEDQDDTDFTKFDPALLKNISFENAYFSTDLSIPEIMFYSFVLEEVIDQVDILRAYLWKNENTPFDELNAEYVLCGLQEDLATVSLFIAKSWRTLYHVLGKKDFHKVCDFYQMMKKQKKNRIFQNCDLDSITNIMSSYYENSPKKDNPDLLIDTLFLLLRTLP